MQVTQTKEDHLSTYGQFFRFIGIHEGHDVELGLEMFLSTARIAAFAEFLRPPEQEAQHHQQQMWHLCTLYDHWGALPDLQSRTHAISAARRMARRYGADAKSKRLGSGQRPP